ncbi:hypothetical protein H3Z83_00730 [Tenacibaculum sp. S7007]|uniref:Uncharacterized protein n=1 Tax=Tenacibaculum pelagium TaxID=2759527 RepID=A0A839AKZ4_9FLAO|nr:hypothetical protein [Tenacibaculum pelagium]MBA6155050.1 hypothetical protein [Tenacibaculum pelagium]
MKKIILLATLFISAVGYSQIEFIDTARTEVVAHVEFVYIEKVGDESYSIFYKNMNDPINEYVSFTFKNENDDFNKLHQFLVSGFENPGQVYKVKANGDAVYFRYERQDDNEVKVQIKQYISRDPDVTTVSKFISVDEVNKLFQK